MIVNCKLRPGMIKFGVGGSYDLIDFESKKNYLQIEKGASIVFNGSASFACHTSLLVTKRMEFGMNFRSNNGCRFSCLDSISIGDDCMIGGNVVIRDSDGHIILENGERHSSVKPIIIGNHVWIANNVSVLKGCLIASNSVIGYGSLVVKDLNVENALYAGVPAKLIKGEINWQR